MDSFRKCRIEFRTLHPSNNIPPSPYSCHQTRSSAFPSRIKTRLSPFPPKRMSGFSTPTFSSSSSAILEQLQQNGLFLDIESHPTLVNTAATGLEEDFRTRLTAHLRSRHPATSETEIKKRVDVLAARFDFRLRCDKNRQDSLMDMLDIALMMVSSL